MQLVAVALVIITVVLLVIRKILPDGFITYLANVITIVAGIGAILAFIIPTTQPSPSDLSTTLTPTSPKVVMATDTEVASNAVSETPIPTNTPTQQPITSIDFTVQANAQRGDTRLDVKKGQYVTIEYIAGNWRAGDPNRWALVGANGDPAVPHGQNLGFPIPNENLLMLIGGVGNSPPIAIGVKNEFQSNTDGVLWLGPNDDTPEDNIGSLTVRISIR